MCYRLIDEKSVFIVAKSRIKVVFEVNLLNHFVFGEQKQNQLKRNKQDQELITSRMEKTFPDRRRQIIQENASVATIKDIYPILFSGREVCICFSAQRLSTNQSCFTLLGSRF